MYRNIKILKCSKCIDRPLPLRVLSFVQIDIDGTPDRVSSKIFRNSILISLKFTV